MNQSQIHPALRQQSSSAPAPPFSSPPRRETLPEHPPPYPQSAYSPLQPSPAASYRGIPTPQYYSQGLSAQSPDDDESPVAGQDGGPATGSNPHDPNDLKRPRACEACRQLKVKCELDDSNPNATCKRCAKAGRQCVVTAPTRKRQKKTDSRVAELEKKIDALTQSLVARGGAAPHPAPEESIDETMRRANSIYAEGSTMGLAQSPVTVSSSLKRKMPFDYDYVTGETPKSTPASYREPPVVQAAFDAAGRARMEDQMSPDVIERRIIDLKSATRCFDRYMAEMCNQLPLVVFQPGTRMEDVRKQKPFLFLSILAASAGTIRPDIQQTLVGECTKILADRVLYRGEKSLELVQMIQVMTIFYIPPERYEELNFNQLIHIAAVMALDIGMGKRSRVGAFAMWREYMDRKQPLPDSSAAETRRCWLGCYYMCANSSMSLRRPLLIRWSPYADECLEILSTSPDALPSDKWLCNLVRAQHIAEDIGSQFSMDDPASQISLTDSKTQYHLKAFERQLSDWRDSSPQELKERPLMKHTDAIINLYMHEIAMHQNHNIDDFKPPYNITPIDGPPDVESITPAHIESLTACLQSIHSAFDAILAMDVTTLRALPTLFFVRNSYAAVALIKMYSAVAAKGSKFGSIFRSDDLQVESYLDRMIATLSKTGEGGASRVAYKFSFIFTMLKNWHLKRTETPAAPNGGSVGNSGNIPGIAGPRGMTTGGMNARHALPASTVADQSKYPTPIGMRNIVGVFNQAMANLPEPANTTAAAMAWNPPVDNGNGSNGGGATSRTGLQMLSDAAAGKDTPSSTTNTPSTAMSNLLQTQTQQPTPPPPPPPHHHTHQSRISNDPFTSQPPHQNANTWPLNPSSTSSLDPNIMSDINTITAPTSDIDMNMTTLAPMALGQTAMGQAAQGGQGQVEMDNWGFTSDELMAMGNLMDDPGWFSFGLEQGGWAF